MKNIQNIILSEKNMTKERFEAVNKMLNAVAEMKAIDPDLYHDEWLKRLAIKVNKHILSNINKRMATLNSARKKFDQ